MKRNLITLSLTLVVGLAAAVEASAQALSKSTFTETMLNTLAIRNSVANFNPSRIQRQVVNQTVPVYNFTPTNYRNLLSTSLVGAQRGSKPFSSLSNPQSVSPYLALSEPFTSSAQAYYTQVRPQLEQQRMNQQMAARAMQMQQQLTSMAARPPYDPSGNQNMMPTGHTAVFMNYGGYYPQPGPPQRRR